MFTDNGKVYFLNQMEVESTMKTLTAMCEVLAKNIAERDNRTVEDVLADAYLDSGRDLWHESFDAVVKRFQNTAGDKSRIYKETIFQV